jgi:zinc and cadmium transporter
MELGLIILVTSIISLGSLVGILTLAVNERKLESLLILLVSLSAGTMIGGAVIHLLPKASEYLTGEMVYSLVLGSFILSFLLEKLLQWRHCHKGKCEVHTFGYMNLIGDGVHNFIDGLVIAAAFLTDIRLGLVTSLAIALHEIPQEIGDFGVLLYAGFKKRRALILNLLVALTVVVGGIAGYWLSFVIEGLTPVMLPVAAGGFIYIAASDLMPEIRKETRLIKSLGSFAVFLSGVLLMILVKQVGG